MATNKCKHGRSGICPECDPCDFQSFYVEDHNGKQWVEEFCQHPEHWPPNLRVISKERFGYKEKEERQD